MSQTSANASQLKLKFDETFPQFFIANSSIELYVYLLNVDDTLKCGIECPISVELCYEDKIPCPGKYMVSLFSTY